MNRSIFIQAPIYLTFIKLLISPLTASLQNPLFIRSGIIEYEKSVNMYAKLKKKAARDMNISKENVINYEKTHPQFIKTKGILKFGALGSSYNGTDDVILDVGTTLRDPWAVAKNKVQSDFQTDSVTTLKNVYGQEFFVKYKKNSILWKYTNEVRDIAGYECKRANGLILDSIYVVAFYCDKIIPSGGPECFSGLPGMILGIALPTENVSWFATSVKEIQMSPIPYEKFPGQRKPISWREYKELLDRALGTGIGNKESLIAFLL